jgi:hypothetical protein
MMNLITRLAPALALLLFCTSPAIAQTPQDPQITIQHPGFQVLKKDLKSLLDLGTPADQKQWSNIEDFIDTFVAGIDGSRPFQVQLLAGMTPSGYLAALPLDGGFQTFRDNVEGLGYELKRDGKDTSLYQFNMTLDSDQESTPGAAAAEDVGWMKVLADVDYLILSMSSTRSSMPQLKELTLAKKVADSGTGTGAVMQLINPDVTEAAQKHRRSSFTASRKTTMDAMQKRPDETATRFEMRKLSSNLMLDEVERATAESETLQISLQMDHSAPTTPKVSVQGDLAAIAGTALATALQQFNTRPDAFAGIARLPGSALSLRINHPIDDMRKAGMTSFLNLVRDEVSAKLKNGSQRPASEKEAIDGVVTDIVTHLRSGIDSGWMNIFVEAVPDGQGGFNSIGAYNAANAATLTEILPRMKDMHPGTQVELNVDKAGDYVIHRVQLGEGLLDVFDRLFGVRRDTFVAVGKDYVWLASGENALDTLKKTVAALAPPAATPAAVHLEVALLPWARQMSDYYSRQTPPKEREALTAWKAAERSRARGLESFEKGNDSLIVDIRAEAGHLLTSISIDTGLLRFIGREMAAFSKENLEAE